MQRVKNLQDNFMKNIFATIFSRESKLNIDQLILKRTIISFFFFFLFGAIAFWGWKKLRHQHSSAAGTRPFLRRVLNANESVFNGFLSDKHQAKEYPASKAAPIPRFNGFYGIRSSLDSAHWAMKVIRSSGDTLKITLDDLKKLPKTDITFNFKCIEGWSQISRWAGVRFRDFIKAYGLNAETDMKYIGLVTPDKEYYVGIDMPSAMHPQTILCYEMNGQPLSLEQGYPLRLIIPVKYGIKNLKRIGTLFFDNKRPPDYWYERGYDYFSGL